MSNKLKKSPNELEQFARMCSHELKEPLRIFTNFVQLLLVHNSGSFDDTSKEYIKHIFKSIHHMDYLLKKIFIYSQISSTRESYCDVNLNEILSEIHSEVTFCLREVGGAIQIDNLPTVFADSTQMRRLFTNLIDNAIKFRSQNALLINISAIDKKTMWELSVSDNGIGIEKEYHNSVFEMFTRLNSRDLYEGSGIGLSICQKIVEAHGGGITVQSHSAGGCEFKVSIPK